MSRLRISDEKRHTLFIGSTAFHGSDPAALSNNLKRIKSHMIYHGIGKDSKVGNLH